MSQGGRPTCDTIPEILRELGQAFDYIGQFAILMNSNFESSYPDGISDKEIEIFSLALRKFCVDIAKMCWRIKYRTLLKIRNTMRPHSYKEAGLPLRKQITSASKAPLTQEMSKNTTPVLPQSPAKSAPKASLVPEMRELKVLLRRCDEAGLPVRKQIISASKASLAPQMRELRVVLRRCDEAGLPLRKQVISPSKASLAPQMKELRVVLRRCDEAGFPRRKRVISSSRRL